VRIIAYTGKGGVGKTTTSAATALRLADRGLKTLVLSTDPAHSLGDTFGVRLGNEPSEIIAGLHGVHIDTQARFERSWKDIQGYLLKLLAQGGTDPITADELTVLPGLEEVLALLAIREYASSGGWDVLVLDCAPTAETLRLLALPEALGWYLERVFPLHRKLAKGLRPFTSMLGRADAMPPEATFDAIVRLADELAGVRRLLGDPAVTSVRLVLTPEAVVTAEARRTFTALSLYGYQVDEVIANRIIPTVAGETASRWQQGWMQAQALQLAAIGDSFGGLRLRRAPYLSAEPVGLAPLRTVADELYGELAGADDPAAVSGELPVQLQVESRTVDDGANPGRSEFVLKMMLPNVCSADVQASRSGDDVVITVGGHRRIVSLPSALRRCVITGGSVADGHLRLRFEPGPRPGPTRTTGSVQ